ncbi:MAG TPA: ABC transporter ATP-binding protein [Firmicutes bacterium]|nr:ABC transporter ATP-binding protein [Bacillota bacterium]
MRIEIKKLAKSYRRKKVLRDLSWQLEKGKSYVVTGPNGSGKSTLLRLLSGLEKMTAGEIVFYTGEMTADPITMRGSIGLVSPDIQFYGQLSPLENLTFFAALRGLNRSRDSLENLLTGVQLAEDRHRPVGAFSSGMKQRLRLAFALLHEPGFLFLDEPFTNLDRAGKELVNQIIANQVSRGIVLIATNEPSEVERFGQDILQLAPRSMGPG